MRQEVTLTITPDSFIGVVFWCAFGTVMAVRFAPDWLLPLLPFAYFAWVIWRAAREVKAREREARLAPESDAAPFDRSRARP